MHSLSLLYGRRQPLYTRAPGTYFFINDSMEWILLGHVRFGQTFFYPFKFLKERSLYTAVALISYHILFLDIVLRCSLRKFISSLFSFPQDVKNKRLRSEQIFRWVIPPQPQS